MPSSQPWKAAMVMDSPARIPSPAGSPSPSPSVAHAATARTIAASPPMRPAGFVRFRVVISTLPRVPGDRTPVSIFTFATIQHSLRPLWKVLHGLFRQAGDRGAGADGGGDPVQVDGEDHHREPGLDTQTGVAGGDRRYHGLAQSLGAHQAGEHHHG